MLKILFNFLALRLTRLLVRMVIHLDTGYILVNTLITMLYSDIKSFETYLAFEAL